MNWLNAPPALARALNGPLSQAQLCAMARQLIAEGRTGDHVVASLLQVSVADVRRWIGEMTVQA